MAWKVLAVLFVASRICSSDSNGKFINLNEFIDANLAYSELIFPLSYIVRGFPLGVLDTTDALYERVHVFDIKGLRRRGDCNQTVDLDAMNNLLMGGIGSDSATLSVGRLTSPTALGIYNLTNVKIRLNSPVLYLQANISSTPDDRCNLSLSFHFSVEGPVVLVSPYLFYNNTDVSSFFSDSFVSFVNKMLNQVNTFPLSSAKCDPLEQVQTLLYKFIKKIKY